MPLSHHLTFRSNSFSIQTVYFCTRDTKIDFLSKYETTKRHFYFANHLKKAVSKAETKRQVFHLQISRRMLRVEYLYPGNNRAQDDHGESPGNLDIPLSRNSQPKVSFRDSCCTNISPFDVNKSLLHSHISRRTLFLLQLTD